MSTYTKEECRGYVGAMEQLADARMSVLEEGNGRGCRVIRVSNGSGLDFTVTPDRGMDIVECSFKGIPVAFRSPVGHASPGRYEPQGQGWLRNWPGGMLTTCGLRNVGRPNNEFGQHGRISNATAEDVGIRRGWTEAGYTLLLAGTLRESAMFGEFLELKRNISTAWGDNSIIIEDELTNLAARDEVFQLLYHCNFGYPFISPSLVFENREHRVLPIDSMAERNLARWHEIYPPAPGRPEECYFHRLPSAGGVSEFTISNPDVGIRMAISYETRNLPNFVMWKNCLANSYALGLEPTNAGMRGRTADHEAGETYTIRPDETLRFRLQLKFESI